MLRRQFPDLAYLKHRINTEWVKGIGWPTILMNAKARQEYRPDINGPLSLFYNVRGESRVGVHRYRTALPQGFFFLSNPGEPYSLEIDSRIEVETFNVHFGEAFASDVLANLGFAHSRLLEKEGKEYTHSELFFPTRLYRAQPEVTSLLNTLRAIPEEEIYDLRREELLCQLLHQVYALHESVGSEVSRLPAAGAATRTELYRRLCQSLDYLHSHSGETLHLEDLATAGSLSKYHFLRLFKAAFGTTPNHYLQTMRIEKAKESLLHSQESIGLIAAGAGYENHSSFSRAFYKRFKQWPERFRQAAL